MLWEKVLKNLKMRKIKFESVIYKWLEVKKNSIKQSTYSNYVYSINKYIMPQFGSYSIRKLQRYNFNQYVQEMNETLSPKTIRDILCILKSILYYAEQEYDCDFKIKKIVSPKLDLDTITILNKKERNRLEKYCLKEHSLKSIGIIICLNAGLRIGEICALKWKNIDLEKRELHIKSTLQRIYDTRKTNTKIIIDKPKTKTSTRTIPISNKLYSILVDLKKDYKNEDFFLTGNCNKCVEPRGYQYTYKEILKKCKMKEYKFHILRHTFATNCIEVGMDIKSLSEVLGHANVEITLNKYVHSSYKTKKKFLEKL